MLDGSSFDALSMSEDVIGSANVGIGRGQVKVLTSNL